jgi:hypothetical protein
MPLHYRDRGGPARECPHRNSYKRMPRVGWVFSRQRSAVVG